MTSKRKALTSPVDPPEPKKRVTRSSTKAKASGGNDAKTEPKQPIQKPSKSKDSAPSKAKKEVLKSPKHKADDKQDKNREGPTTLTIDHDSIKSPITCHQYTPDSKSIPEVPTLIFTHGAGGTLSAAAVVNFCTGYSKHASILAFQGSMNLKARTKGFQACISHLSTTTPKARKLVLGGRSMGARAAVIAATELLSSSPSSVSSIDLVLVSYPLNGPKGDVRDQILLDLPATMRVLFIIGDKDAMCPLSLLGTTREKMVAKSQLVVVEGADHGMHVRGKDMETKMGERSGMLAFQWVSGTMEEEEVWIRSEDVDG
jgi:predicted alpha/beta-hydrolase family hydrolase